jgi:hypothetical protein
VDIGLWTSGETGPVTFVADGDTIDVDVAGDGTSTRSACASRASSTHSYSGLSAAIFEDVTSSATYLGDGGYLFDPQGELRRYPGARCQPATGAGAGVGCSRTPGSGSGVVVTWMPAGRVQCTLRGPLPGPAVSRVCMAP